MHRKRVRSRRTFLLGAAFVKLVGPELQTFSCCSKTERVALRTLVLGAAEADERLQVAKLKVEYAGMLKRLFARKRYLVVSIVEKIK